jgi:hypothetical protein
MNDYLYIIYHPNILIQYQYNILLIILTEIDSIETNKFTIYACFSSTKMYKKFKNTIEEEIK